MTFVVFAVLVWKVIDFLRMLFNLKSQKSGVITQLTAWVGGIILIIIGSHAAVTSALTLPGIDQPLHSLDFASQILLGLLVASLASATVDIKQAIDGSDSAAKPPVNSSLVTTTPPTNTP